MNLFLTALRPTGEPVRKSDLFGFLARLPQDQEFESLVEGPFAAMAATGARALRPLIGRFRHLIGVGDVRLDRRSDWLPFAQGAADRATDLQLVLAAIDARGVDVIKELHGDFAFVVWDARAQKIVAARDAFGVKPLFMRHTNGLLLFSTRAAPLATNDQYDLAYLRDFLFGMPLRGRATAWSDVRRLEAGTVFQQRGTAGSVRTYWAAHDFSPAASADEKESVSEFRQLFQQAVAQRLDAHGRTWAQLSGGLDSSSVVCTAEQLVDRGTLAGTITVVDTMGEGDERAFSNLVVQKYDLRNEQVQDAWPWEQAESLTLIDEPSQLYPFQRRDQRVRDVVRANHAHVLLSGLGSDHYLFGNLGYIPDLVLAGRLLHAARELTAWSLVTRRSFWWMARRHALEPLMRGRLRPGRDEDAPCYPRWLGDAQRVSRDFERVFDLQQHAPRGRRFSMATAREMATIPAWVHRDGFETGMEVRYPFLSRPLVEFSLRLPVHMRARPFARKWVLREAMRDVLPEAVRTRQRKGSIDARIVWSLQRESATVQALLREPILAELGLLDAQQLRAAVEEARSGVKHNLVMLMSALSLE
ncbi:MAG: asparagine synthetase B family protein, partial [Longimicrobiales bacterium]